MFWMTYFHPNEMCDAINAEYTYTPMRQWDLWYSSRSYFYSAYTLDGSRIKMARKMTIRVNFIIAPLLNHATNADLWHVHCTAIKLRAAIKVPYGIVMNPVQILREYQRWNIQNRTSKVAAAAKLQWIDFNIKYHFLLGKSLDDIWNVDSPIFSERILGASESPQYLKCTHAPTSTTTQQRIFPQYFVSFLFLRLTHSFLLKHLNDVN